MTVKNSIQFLTSAAEPADSNWEPSPKQIDFLNAALKAGLNRNIAAVCRDAGVSRVAFYNWLRQPGFAALWESMPRKVLSAHMPGVMAAMVRKAQEGDTAAAKLLFQATGLIGRDVVGSDTVATTNVHLELVRRADNWEQFQEITRAVDEARQRAEPGDDGVQRVNDKLSIASD